MLTLQAGFDAVLDRRLREAVDPPLAVALSGGGDSLALLLAAHDWAGRHGRRLLVLTVDHRLQSQSEAWTRRCAAMADQLGAAFQALAWEGPKPATGLPAAARQARHRLVAQAAREAGARVILMGHTADDIAEARAMRGEGSTVGAPREWAPSPIWPEGRDIFLLRPLLGARRAVLRQWLTARGASWIEDPANDDPRFARARARTESPAPSEGVPPEPCIAPLARACTAESWGLALARGRLREVSAAQAERFVAAACLCAAGTHRPPRHDRLANLTARLRGEPPVVSTLAGARVEADGDQVRLLREPGELARSRLEPTDLPAGAAAVWDGRFEIVSRRAGLTVQPLRGQAARLPAAARRALAMVPAGARGALPLITGNGVFDCPVLSPMQEVEVRALAYPRLLAASGAVTREP